MASVNVVDPHQLLFENLSILHELQPGSSEFQRCIKEDMFKKPNRTAFDLALFYLCCTYDKTRYMTNITWPALDRIQERAFRQNTTSFIKEIIKERPEARIPNFSQSFHSTPGGDRLAKFMWKFSLLVLHDIVQRESDEPVLEFPTAGLHLVEAMTQSTLQDVAKKADELACLLIDASSYSEKLIIQIGNQQKEIKTLQSELVELVQNLRNCPLSDKEKLALLSDDPQQFETVIQKWQNILTQETEKASILQENIEAKSNIIEECYRSVKAFADSKTMPVVLDASHYPSSLKDSSGKIDLVHLLSEGSNATSSILTSISMFGGFQSLDTVLPALENVHAKLESIQTSLSNLKCGYVNLISESKNSTTSPSVKKAELQSPPLKGGLELGYEMLQDAQACTPQLVFNVDSNLPAKFRISTESPPMTGIAGVTRPYAGHGPTSKSGADFTPKIEKFSSGASLKVNKMIPPRFASARDSEMSQPKMKAHINSSQLLVAQTPVTFNSKFFATSTVCKPTASFSNIKTSNLLPVPKLRSVTNEISPSLVPNKFFNISDQETNQTIDKCNDDVKCVPAVATPSEGRKILLKEMANKAEENISKVTKTGEIKAKVPWKDQDAPIQAPATKKIFEDRSLKESSSTKELLRELDFLTLSNEPKIENSSLQGITNSPKVTCTSDTVQETSFDSSRSSLGVFSPVSAENSFFINDVIKSNPEGTTSVRTLSLEFEDDISPSGRVSLCAPLDVHEPQILKEPLQTVKEGDAVEAENTKVSSKRKSLQALISRFRDVVASSKQIVIPVVSPLPSPEHDKEGAKGEFIDLNLSLDL